MVVFLARLAVLTLIVFTYAASQTGDDSRQHMKDAFASAGDLYNKEITKAEDMFSTSADDLQAKVDETVQFLLTCKEHEKSIATEADAKGILNLKKATTNIDRMLTEATEYKNKVQRDLKRRNQYEILEREWKQKAQVWWGYGLGELTHFAQSLAKEPVATTHAPGSFATRNYGFMHLNFAASAFGLLFVKVYLSY